MNSEVEEKINHVYEILATIPDPEIPVISILELGVIREVSFDNDFYTVKITPTYSGCPAMKHMEKEIIHKFEAAGLGKPIIKMIYEPAWTTDWISDEAKNKLLQYGIAPPEHSSVEKRVLLGLQPKVVKCPQCKSSDTTIISQFGSTSCKAMYKCSACLEVFDYFKCI